jgi:heme exporter protein D
MVTSAISQWLAMGGYAGFVWPAYAIAAVVLGWLAVYSWRRHRQSTRLLAQLQRETGRDG